LSFPDASKSRLYQWRYSITRAPGDNFSVVRQAGNAVGALPQEYETDVVIAAIPSGADFLRGDILLVRTGAPTHPWLGSNLTPVIPQNTRIPLAGTFVLEMGPGISRGVTFLISGGNLVARLDQSVGPAAGNFGTNGTMPIGVPPNSTSDNYREGAENLSATGIAGLPVWWDAGTFISQGTSYVGVIGPGSISAGVTWANAARLGGANEVPYSDPTNYASTYSFTARIRYGIKS